MLEMRSHGLQGPGHITKGPVGYYKSWLVSEMGTTGEVGTLLRSLSRVLSHLMVKLQPPFISMTLHTGGRWGWLEMGSPGGAWVASWVSV